jgi:hypothetical protein
MITSRGYLAMIARLNSGQYCRINADVRFLPAHIILAVPAKGLRMAQIHFTSWLRTVVPDAPVTASGETVGEALNALLADRPHVRSYVLDEQGRLRKHVCIFADGARLPREAALAHPIHPESQLHVMQALSGG